MTPLGVALALLIALAYGVSPVIQKLILTDISVETMLFLLALPVSLGFILFIGLYHKKILADFKNKHVTPRVMGRAAFLGVFCALIPYLMYAYLLKKFKSHYVAALVACAPVFTFLMTKLIFKEQLTILSLIGVALIVGGVACIILSSGRYADPLNE